MMLISPRSTLQIPGLSAGIHAPSYNSKYIDNFLSVFCGVAISLTLYRFFQKHKESVYIFETLNGLKAASLGLIVSAAATIILLSFFGTGDPDLKTMKESLDIGAVAIFGGVLFLSRKRKINPIMLMLVSGAAGIILYM